MCRRTVIRGAGIVIVVFAVLWLIGRSLPPKPDAELTPGVSSVAAVPTLTITPTSAPTITIIPPTLDAAGQAIIATQQWFLQQETQAAGGQAVQFVPTQPHAAVAVAGFDQADYEAKISNSIAILAGGRHVVGVRVVDQRPQGGLRAVSVLYMTTESTEPGYVDEWIDLYEAVAVSIKNDNLDVDVVALIVTTATGQLAGTVEVSAADLMSYWSGQLDRLTFINRLRRTAF